MNGINCISSASYSDPRDDHGVENDQENNGFDLTGYAICNILQEIRPAR